MYLLVTFAAEIGSSDTHSIAPLLAFVHISSIAELVVQQAVGLVFFLLSFVS